MNIIRAILCILLFPLILLAAFGFLVAFSIASFIEDIYDDDMYWGGKE